ncbi:MAG: hypothetical protein J7K22_03265 [Nanoarchaeota archaeon]|nr:hypothetical protein [Nanoarchaeota archaeon]
MKKLVFFALMFFMFSIAYSKVSVQTNIPERLTYKVPVNMIINISSDSQKYDVALITPIGWDVIWYNVSTSSGFDKKDSLYLGQESTVFRWIFRNVSEKNVYINLSFVPLSTGEFKVYVLWTYPGGFSSKEFKVSLTPVCGNYICEPGESVFICPIDCGLFSKTFLVLILIAATFIVVSGVLYQEYIKYKVRRR